MKKVSHIYPSTFNHVSSNPQGNHCFLFFWCKLYLFIFQKNPSQINKSHTKKKKTNSSPENDQRQSWKCLGKYGTLSLPFGFPHMKRNKKTWTFNMKIIQKNTLWSLDTHTWPSKSRTTSSNIHTAAMWGYRM